MALSSQSMLWALEFNGENSQSCQIQVVPKSSQSAANKRLLCQATLLRTQKVAFTPTCFPSRIAHRTHKLQVSCLEGLVVKDITAAELPYMQSDQSGIHYLNVDVKMDLPLRPSSKRAVSEENCYYEHDNSRHSLPDFNAQNVDLWGAPVYCTQDESPLLVGILGATGLLEFESPEELNLGETHSPDSEIQNVCQELGHCLDDLVGLPDDLEDKIRVVEHMIREDDIAIRGSVSQLRIDAYALLHKCHEEKIDAQLEPKKLESGFFALLTGKMESAYMSAFHSHEDMADEVMSSAGSLLSEPDTINSQIVSWLDSSEASDLSNLDKIKGAAQIVASAVLKEKMTPLGLTEEAEQEAVLLRIMPSFKECLESAVNASSKVKECSEELQKKAPIVIGRAVVEKNFEKNFSSQFKNEADEAQLRKYTLATFDRCISDFYLEEMNEQSILNTEEMTKACVYESLSASFNKVVEKKIEDNISELEIPAGERLSLKREIIDRGLNCSMGAIISKAPNYSTDERRYLGKVTSAAFENSVKECQNAITTYASDTLIPKILSSHRDIVKAIPDVSARASFVSSVIEGPYKDCKNWFENQNIAYNVLVCESIVRHEAFNKVAALELTAKAESYGVEDTLKIMLDFKACNMRIEQQLLALTPYEDREREEIACLQSAVLALSGAAVPIKIQAEIDAVASLAPIKEQILSSPGIVSLDERMKSCLAESLAGSEDLTAFNSKLQESIDTCTFQVTKSAYGEIVPMALELELQKNIPDQARRTQFIENFKRDTLNDKLADLERGTDSQSFLNAIKKDVMRAYAQSELDLMLEAPLAQIKSSTTREQLAREVRADFIACIESNQNVESCPNVVTITATKKIGGAALEENIRSVVKDERANELSDRARGELNRCIDRLESPTERAAKACVGVAAINLTATIPTLVLSDYARAIGSNLSPQSLNQELTKVRNFYEANGSANFNDRDPAVMLYAAHETCLSSARDQMSRNILTLESALEVSNHCAKQFEESVVNSMRRKFTGVSTSQTIRGELSKIFDVLMLFKDAAKPSGAENSGKQEDLAPLMEMIADMSKAACNYDLATCQARVRALKADMINYAQTPPAKTMEELKERLVRSSFMDLIIEAQVANSLKSELTSGLATMRDNIGYLDMSINNITSPGILRSIMESGRGRVLLAEVKAKILAGETDNLTASPRIRQALAGALVANTSHNSFVDHLFYGIVEPELIQKKGSFTGVLGRALGIVKSDKFTWREIRRTPEGQQARALFARFFAGVVTGDVQASDIKAPSARIKSMGYPSEQQIVDLITQGLKSL